MGELDTQPAAVTFDAAECVVAIEAGSFSGVHLVLQTSFSPSILRPAKQDRNRNTPPSLYVESVYRVFCRVRADVPFHKWLPSTPAKLVSFQASANNVSAFSRSVAELFAIREKMARRIETLSKK